jgi:gamma-glutamyltranspeptidase / glutathione hydrolase
MTQPRVMSAPASHRGVVVSAHRAATAAGAGALAAGGNAIDAAVAAAWALCVCEPSGSGLGGQTVAIVRTQARTFAVGGHSYAPSLVSRLTVTRLQQRLGHRATTVPTTPAALAYLQSRYGRLTRAEVLAPAIELAERGYEVSALHHRQLRWCRAALAASGPAGRFLRDGRPFMPGEVFAQPALAECLRRLARFGVEDFYGGEIARAVDRDMRRNAGLLRLADLQALQSPIEQNPISTHYRGHVVMTMPAPGGGPQLVHALNALQQRDSSTWSGDRDQWYLAVAAAVRGAFENREREHRRPYAGGGTPAVALHGAAGEHGGETTHLCAADTDGNVVALTQSIQSLFGAKVANDRYGFLYNNYLTTCPRRRHAHRLGGGCPARSNAAPALVFRAGATTPALALGAAGSRRIISSIVQVLSAVVDLDMTLDDAVGQPRIHPRLSGTVLIEKPAATPRLVGWLNEHGGRVEVRREHSYAMGAVQALQLTPALRMQAAADPRREGSAGQW